MSVEVLLFKYTKNKQVGNIPKGVRDVEVDIPGVLKLGKETGILTVGLTGASVIGDIKNNKTVAQKFKASGVDIAMTGISYEVGGGAVALIGMGCAAVAAPEIVTAGLVVGDIVGIGVVANLATNKRVTTSLVVMYTRRKVNGI